MIPGNLMNDLLGVAEAEANRARVTARGAAIRGGAWAVAGVLFLGAAALMAVGVYQELLKTYEPISAAAMIAGALLAVAILLVTVVMLFANRKARMKAKAEAALARAALAGDVATVLASVRVLGLSPMVIGVGALAAGVLAGASGGGSESNHNSD